MSKPEILQLGSYSDRDETELGKHFTLHRYFELTDAEKTTFLASKGSDIRAIATRGDLAVDATLINALPSLELISVYGVGYDGVDLSAAKARGIKVSNTPDVLTKDVADLAVAMLLTAGRRMIDASEWVRTSQWQAQGMFPLNTRVHGRRAGILGLGRIGFEIANRLMGFEMSIAYSGRQPNPKASQWQYIDNAVELARNVDVLFVSLAACPETKHIVNKEVLEALGPNGIIVNISRAANIDEIALLEALENKTIDYAALDVFENEPNINPRFLELDNVLLQPHQGSGTFETRTAMGDLVKDNIAAHFAGQALLTPVEL